MAKVFRKIRQNLLSENKLIKYLLYAIGEILLVVIGILIALQINNSNEEKKLRALEFNLLSELNVNLTDDLDKINGNLEFQKEILRCQNVVIEWLDNDELFNDSLSYYISRSILTSRFLANSGSYETLKQVGVNIIQNESLRKQVTYLFEVVYPRYYIELDDYKTYAQKILPLFENHLEEMKWFSSLNMLNVQKLKSDQKLKYTLKTLKNIGNLLPNRVTINARAELDKTLKMLQEELGKE